MKKVDPVLKTASVEKLFKRYVRNNILNTQIPKLIDLTKSCIPGYFSLKHILLCF